jgi:hydroxyquinol 1,2-dioxygenase
MHDLDVNSITAAVLASFETAKTPRTRCVSEALVRHLHAFIREIEPTQEEWEWGIEFLTSTGHMCSETRQEFILLSDTLGVSMLVDAINNRVLSRETETTVFGPFYVEPQEFPNGGDIRIHLEGTPMYVSGSVQTVDGAPISGAIVDVWHSDKDGYYDLQRLDETHGYAGRGRFRTDEVGRFDLWTVRPSSYPIPDDGPVGKMLEAQGRHPFRPEHIHFKIQAPGYRKLVTHVFAAGDQYLGSDVVFGVKASLIREYRSQDGGVAPDGRSIAGRWHSLHYDFVLSAANTPSRAADRAAV